MYDNIGQKIKGLSNAIFVILAVIGASCGLIVMITSVGIMVIVGLIMFIVVPVLAWVLSWLLYGFGELIESQCIATEILQEIRDSINEKSITSDNLTDENELCEYENALHEYENTQASICPNCNTEQPDHRTTCWKCGANIVE